MFFTQVRHAAGPALVSIARLLDPEDVEKHVLTMVLCMAHEESDVPRTTAVPVSRCGFLIFLKELLFTSNHLRKFE